MKILCVEDGSVDLDALEEEPLRDGKVLVYREGATPPYVVELTDTNENVIEELRKVQTQLVRNDRLQCLNYVIDNLQKENKQALASQKEFYEKKLNSQPAEIVEKIKSRMDNVVDTLINCGNGKEDAIAWFCGVLQEILKEYGEE